VEVQLLYFEGCPHWAVMEERLREALRLTGNSQTIKHVLVESTEEADALGFAGSPSLLIGGQDPFPSSSTECGLSCRVYSTPGGPQGAPTIGQLVSAIDEGSRSERP
jgi:hypothetical protein